MNRTHLWGLVMFLALAGLIEPAWAVTKPRHGITVMQSEGGKITPAPKPGVMSVLSAEGTSKVFSLKPRKGYHLANVTVDGSLIYDGSNPPTDPNLVRNGTSTVWKYRFSNVMAAHSIAATFALDIHTLTVNLAGYGTGAVVSSPDGLNGISCIDDHSCTGTGSFEYGTHVTLTVFPAAESIVRKWTGCKERRTTPSSCTLLVKSDKTVTVTFGTAPEIGDMWSAVPSGAPVSVDHTAVWTGSAMIVWGDSRVNSGGKYDPDTDTWNDISSVNAPEPRTVHTAVWTGTEMIVWGGINSDNVNLDTGGKFNPVMDTWSETSTSNAPFGRRGHVAVWTGTEMIVWGGTYTDGVISKRSNTGARYNPVTDTWVATSTLDAPPAASYRAVWTGSEMIVWNGSEGGRYNPLADSWESISVEDAPLTLSNFSVVWTGTEMIVWGGWTGVGALVTNTGGRYNPSTDSWSSVSQSGAATARYRHTAVWTGTEMIIWGGLNGSYGVSGGKLYSPQTNTWAPVSATDEPWGRFNHSAVWTGTEMIIWGGWDATTGFATNNGGSYVP